MKKILLVEDSKMFINLVQNRISRDFQIECVIRQSYQEAAELLAAGQHEYLLAILDLTLPGSPDGEIVDLVKTQGIPIVVVTGRMDDLTRDSILEKQVLDYILKGPHTLDLLSGTISRFLRNKDIKILLVEDSRLVRESTKAILEKQQFTVIEANHGKTALQELRKHQDTRVVLTDFNMPEMNGFELTAEIRKNFPMDKLAVIGMSAYGNPLLSAQFLKRGASDFLNKPYFEEELVWRVNQNVEMLVHVEQLRQAAIVDSMTGLYNRGYFFQVGDKLFENARRQNLQISVAMIDIDHFKAINDTYGHCCGDVAIRHVAGILKNSFRSSDIVARFGGEEFIILTSNMDSSRIKQHFEELRERISSHIIKSDGAKIRVSVSIGVCTQLGETFDKTVSKADNLLYEAKNAGRNCVVIS
ncbi:GGDEF domain-containing response regulator [Pelobacter seleniigenes]|uniref:GGDEF domain-containing response regulator n=1 Tax=Pelobacter seleniigenes TaxID=407188 RepID=UPI0004A6A93E|nr:diguanylate cyclase [Pelobacter seleniigenes]